MLRLMVQGEAPIADVAPESVAVLAGAGSR